MGFEIVKMGRDGLDGLVVEEDHIFLGSIQFMHDALKKLGVEVPAPLDYPESLQAFLSREIWESTINEIVGNPEKWNVFVKPKGITKKFTVVW